MVRTPSKAVQNDFEEQSESFKASCIEMILRPLPILNLTAAEKRCKLRGDLHKDSAAKRRKK
jgi:hypothetical protein